jgi:hypothetical protein
LLAGAHCAEEGRVQELRPCISGSRTRLARPSYDEVEQCASIDILKASPLNCRLTLRNPPLIELKAQKTGVFNERSKISGASDPDT